MVSWRVATSLDELLNEVNRSAPNRSKVSDGSIGDAAHASRSSDHNPWRPGRTVGARDFTHDPAGGFDAGVFASWLTKQFGVHPAMGSGAYIIWNWRIFSYDRRSEGWRRYTGSNGHTHHVHLSVCTSQSGFDSTRPWGWGTEEDEMKDADWDKLERMLRDNRRETLDEVKKLLDGQRNTDLKRSDDQVLKELHQRVKRIEETLNKLRRA